MKNFCHYGPAPFISYEQNMIEEERPWSSTCHLLNAFILIMVER